MYQVSTISSTIIRRDRKGRFCKPFVALIADEHTRPRHYNHCLHQVKASKSFPSVWIIYTGKPGPVSSLIRPWYEHLDF